MVQTILYVWLVLSFCVMERQFTEFRFLSGQYQKKGTTEKKKKVPDILFFFFLNHDNIAEQILLDRLETATDSNMCHTMVSST